MELNEREDYYTLGRHHAESLRLSLQHFLWRDMFGWTLHPAATAPWKVEDPKIERRIADIACGNLIWTVEHATDDPSIADTNAKFVAFDLSPAQLPPKSQWPENVTFEQYNIYDPVPEKYKGYFDVIHISLIVLAIRDGDPRPILKNLLDFLRPGGFLQWSESDVTEVVDAPANSAHSRLNKELYKYVSDTHNNDWIPQLGKIFEEQGLEQVEQVAAPPRPKMLKYWHDQLVIALGEIVRMLNNPETDGFWQECKKEQKEQGIYPLFRNQVVIGRKRL